MKTYWQIYDVMTICFIGMLIITGVVHAINGDFTTAAEAATPFSPNYLTLS